MSTINSRIEYLITTFCNGNKSDFANRIGINEANVRSYLNGTEPKFNVIEKIAKNFDINYEWLLFGEGIPEKPKVEKKLYNESITKSITESITKSITESITNQKLKKGYTFDEKPKVENEYPNEMGTNLGTSMGINEKLKKGTQLDTSITIPKVITVDSYQRDNVVLVPVKAAAGYLNGYGDPEFIETLPSYRLPGVDNGVFRMFQVNGHSMYPTLTDKSFVVGQFVGDWINDMKDNRIYVIVSKELGVVVKRCLNRIQKYGNIFAKSDNRRDFPNFSIDPSNIQEIWEVKLALQYDLPDPATLYDKVYDLEADLEELKLRLEQKD